MGTVIFTENNAFQNFGKCLQMNCTNRDQIQDFLQFCIEFIFYDDTHIAGTVPDSIMKDTKEIIQILGNNNFPIETIKFEEFDETIICNLAEIMKDKIDEWVKEVKRYPSFMVEHKVEQYLPTIGIEERTLIEKTTRKIQEGNLENFIDEYLNESTSLANTIYFKIFKTNEDILKKINEINNPRGKNVISNPRWNVAMTMNVISNIRYFANRQLASNKSHYFLPSFKRGVRDYSHYIKVKSPHITDSINNIIIEDYLKREFKIETTSITNYIIEKGRYQPGNIITEVLDLRIKFEPLRDYIRQFVCEKTINNKTFQNELKNIAKQISTKIGNNSSKEYIQPVTNLVTFKGREFQNPEPSVLNNSHLSVCVQAFPEVINNLKKSKYKDDHLNELIRKWVKKYKQTPNKQ
jgi:hypothetical protein